MAIIINDLLWDNKTRESLGYEAVPMDKRIIGEALFKTREGEMRKICFHGYVKHCSDGYHPVSRKIYIWGKVAEKIAAYAELLMAAEDNKIKFSLEPQFLNVFTLAHEFVNQGIETLLLQVIGELAIDFQRASRNQEVFIRGASLDYENWYSLGAQAFRESDHAEIERELQKPLRDRKYCYQPYQMKINQDVLREKLGQRTAICFNSCWELLPLHEAIKFPTSSKLT